MPKVSLDKRLQVIQPPVDAEERSISFIKNLHKTQLQRAAEYHKLRHEARAAYEASLMKLLVDQGGLKVLNQPGIHERRNPSPQRKMVHHPAQHDMAGSPFIGWVVGSDATPTNNASSGGGFISPNLVNMSLNAGTSSSSPQGGKTAVWGYVGNYMQPADPSEWLFGLPTATASVFASYEPAWTITNYFNFFSENANLTMVVNLIFIVYDNSWNYIQTYSSPEHIIYANNNPDSNSYDWGTFNFYSWGPETLSLTPGWIQNDQYFGLFVQFQAWASAAGESTGAAVPGSEVLATLDGWVDSLEVGLLVPIPD